MSDVPTENLIDFNFEETTSANCKNKSLTVDHEALIPSPCLSLENNPFDLVQKLSVFRPDDPFDIVEKEATLKARQICSSSIEVKLGNLLSFSEDSDTTTTSTTDSNIFHTAEEHNLENESPPIALSTKWSPCSSTASCESSDSNKEQACAAKSRKTRNHRNRLLKLSISNAAFSTPNSSRATLDKEEGLRNDLAGKLISLSGDNEESSLESESPVKLVDEDTKVENNSKKQSYTEKDYEHDLEMMKIVSSPDKQAGEENFTSNYFQASQPENQTKLNPLPDLEALRQKLRAKRLESNNQKDISELIKDFKNLITESKMIDEHNKHEVDGLLETLTSTLFASKTTPESSIETSPKPVVRQSTFDIELQQGRNQSTEEQKSELTGRPASIEDIPDTMLKSSATYDGETAEDKAHLNLPQIDPISPQQHSIDPNLKGIIEQLQQFLEQQHLPTENSDGAHEGNATTITTTNNPTFIVVMPTIASSSISEDSYDSVCNYRRRSQSLSLHDKLKIVQLPVKPPSEVQVNETLESSSLDASLCFNTPLSADFKTPARFLERRNSFSSATPLTPARISKFNQSTMARDCTSGVFTSTTPSKFGLRTETRQPVLVQRPNLGLRPDLKKKPRTTSSLLKSNAPLKATLPYKQVAPTLKTTCYSASNTSMHLVSKAGQMSHTSTPMPAQRTNLLTTTGIKSTAHSLRSANNAMTPVGKSLSVPLASAGNLRRRTISEFKAKSPNKTRTNFSNLKSNLSRPSTNASKNTLRPSVGGNYAHPATKNKENKQPQN